MNIYEFTMRSICPVNGQIETHEVVLLVKAPKIIRAEAIREYANSFANQKIFQEGLVIALATKFKAKAQLTCKHVATDVTITSTWDATDE